MPSSSKHQTKIVALAQEMGVSTTDLEGFLACLHVWIAKGQNLEQAIASNMAQMQRFVARASSLSEDKDLRSCLADQLWDAIRAPVTAQVPA